MPRRIVDEIKEMAMDLMWSYHKSWVSFHLNDYCVTFVGAKTKKMHETESLGELAELLKEEEL